MFSLTVDVELALRRQQKNVDDVFRVFRLVVRALKSGESVESGESAEKW